MGVGGVFLFRGAAIFWATHRELHMSVVAMAILCFAVLLGGCGSDNSAKDAGAPQVLNLYGWADYFDPDVISDFEKQNNCIIECVLTPF